jgi:hypothetical protein
MLKAVVHGKAGRIEEKGKPSVSWRTLFKTYEDLMSAAVFSRFSYLSAGAQHYLLQSWLGDSEDFSNFENIVFWPTYQLNDDKPENNVNVEPDLVLRFKDCNLIIEVKRPLGGAQDIEQWRGEIKSFLQSGEDTGKSLYFLAIGGVSPIWTKWADKLISEFTQSPSKAIEHGGTLKQVNALNWQPVVDSFLALEKHALTNGHVLATEQDVRIIQDIIEVFELYDLKTSRFKWPKLVEEHSPTKLSLEHSCLINNKSSFKLKCIDNPTNTNKSLLSLVTQQNKLISLNMEIISKWSIK